MAVQSSGSIEGGNREDFDISFEDCGENENGKMRMMRWNVSRWSRNDGTNDWKIRWRIGICGQK